ncbi:hypothetical protein GCM10020295_43600 [Streptomyces cinereospinus]
MGGSETACELQGDKRQDKEGDKTSDKPHDKADDKQARAATAQRGGCPPHFERTPLCTPTPRTRAPPTPSARTRG